MQNGSTVCVSAGGYERSIRALQNSGSWILPPASLTRVGSVPTIKGPMLKRLVTFLFGLVALAGIGSVWAEGKAQLTIESWRNDDLKIWKDTILPAFVKKHPEIEVVFSPTAPTEYNAVLDAKLKAGTAGDLVACRPSTSLWESSTKASWLR